MASVSRLAAIIDAATTSATPTVDLLRQVKVLASRTGAKDLDDWASGELNGLRDGKLVPKYRGPFDVPAFGTWMSVVRYATGQALTSVGVPDEFRDGWFRVTLRQPVGELEALVASEGADPTIAWDSWAVARYDQYAQAGKVTRMEGHHLVEAHTSVPRPFISGVIDTIRTRVLDLALSLEAVAPDAGDRGGPTIEDPPVAAATQQFHITVYGDGTTIATGDYARVKATVVKGDLPSLREAAIGTGLSAADADEFVAAVKSDGTPDGSAVQRFIDRVRTGAVTLAGGIATGVAADALIELAKAYLGL